MSNCKGQSLRPSSSSNSSSSSNNFKRRAYCSSLFFFRQSLKSTKENKEKSTNTINTMTIIVLVLLAAWCSVFVESLEAGESSDKPRKHPKKKRIRHFVVEKQAIRWNEIKVGNAIDEKRSHTCRHRNHSDNAKFQSKRGNIIELCGRLASKNRDEEIVGFIEA